MNSLFWIELKSLARNKRPYETAQGIGVLMIGNVVYCIANYFHVTEYPTFVFEFVATLSVFMFPVTYAPLSFSWQSTYFDRLITLPLRTRSFFFLYWSVCATLSLLMAVVLTINYLIFDYPLVLNVWSALSYVIGIVTPTLIIVALRNRGRIDLHRSRKLNFQGLTTKHFIAPFMLMILYVFLLWASYVIFDQLYILTGALGLVGCGAFLFYISRVKERSDEWEKYDMAAKFRLK